MQLRQMAEPACPYHSACCIKLSKNFNFTCSLQMTSAWHSMLPVVPKQHHRLTVLPACLYCLHLLPGASSSSWSAGWSLGASWCWWTSAGEPFVLSANAAQSSNIVLMRLAFRVSRGAGCWWWTSAGEPV
jgi:hypothetical protein